jgi:hypothetical protein
MEEYLSTALVGEIEKRVCQGCCGSIGRGDASFGQDIRDGGGTIGTDANAPRAVGQ